MFEVIGWWTLRAYGYGWLWGRRHYRVNKINFDGVFGNGNDILFPLGIASIMVHWFLFGLITGVLNR